ncbi:MAG: hypothetical protein SFU99_14120 [Saprospiraceae bacterium]|nr:hypothetical protein [Saprospiraceae bacterium]
MKTLHVFLLFIFPLSIYSQDTTVAKLSAIANYDYVNIYLTSTDMSYLAAKGEIGAPHKYVLSANINPYFSVLGGHISRLSVAMNPNVKIRIRTNGNPGDSSLPVRTPSFNIGGIAYWRLKANIDTFQYLSAAFYHHSNGQDGSALRPDGSFNTYNGNFSTNYLNFKFNFGKNISRSVKIFGVGKDFFKLNYYKGEIFRHQSLGLEWHPDFFGHEEALEGKYGTLKFRYDYIWALTVFWDHYRTVYDPIILNEKNKPQKNNIYIGTTRDERLRITFNAAYILNKLEDHNILDLEKRLILEGNFHYSPPFTRNSAIFISLGYKGEDEYNIYFQDQYFYFRIGFSSGFLTYSTKLKRENGVIE